VVLEPVDPNARFHERRFRAQRRRKLRRTAFLFALVIAAVSGGGVVWLVSHGGNPSTNDAAPRGGTTTNTSTQPSSNLPKEIRGIHVTMGLASLPGKLDQYISLKDEGLNTIALDIKDENGAVAFSSPEVPLASAVGAAKGNFYNPAEVADQVHADGIYLIGRVAVFEDPVLSARRPDLAIQRSDGSPWLNDAGLGWTNQYDKRVWDYNVSIAKVAAKAGFDEIQFDYTRFPSDGPVSSAVWPGKKNESESLTIDRFLTYATKQLKPFGVRVSVDAFGLAATNSLGIGQSPGKMARIVDAIYPMVYPSHFGPGQYGLPNPQTVPGTTVGYALGDFEAQMRGKKAEIVAWLQDFSMGRTFTLADVQDEVLAVRRTNGARGFLLWNAQGIYTPGALQPAGSNAGG
jgi:hypothetical protein